MTHHYPRPPRDVKQFWVAPHCGPGTLDGNDTCGFCGLPYLRCAERNSETIAEEHRQECGGAGFWCKSCGRFWAQDACGSSGDPRAADGAELSVQDGYACCCCGNRLFEYSEE